MINGIITRSWGMLNFNAIVESFFSFSFSLCLITSYNAWMARFNHLQFSWCMQHLKTYHSSNRRLLYRIRNQRSSYIHPYIRLSLDRTPKCTKGKEAKSIPPLTNGHKNYCMPFKIQCIFWDLTSCNLFAQHCLYFVWICCQLLPGNGFIFKYGGWRNFFPELCFCLFFN